MKKTTLALVILLCGCLVGAGADVIFTLTFANQGIIQGNIGVYFDENCTRICRYLEWGEMTAGATQNLTVYFRNALTSAVILHMRTSNFYPEDVADYFNCSWNAEDRIVYPNEVAELTFTLSILPSLRNTNDFGFIVTLNAVSV